jgi:hypothetical protein
MATDQASTAPSASVVKTTVAIKPMVIDLSTALRIADCGLRIESDLVCILDRG